MIQSCSIKSKQNPLVVNQFHSWVVHVETPEGKAVENANIKISGGMPAHKHGFPTSPRITKYFGNGDYLLEGVKFSMPGPWVMRLKVTAAGKSIAPGTNGTYLRTEPSGTDFNLSPLEDTSLQPAQSKAF